MKMYEKLSSLELFKKNKLNTTHQSRVLGGRPRPTNGGEFCSVASDTGCVGYTSDTTDGNMTTYHGIFEVDKECIL